MVLKNLRFSSNLWLARLSDALRISWLKLWLGLTVVMVLPSDICCRSYHPIQIISAILVLSPLIPSILLPS